MKDILPIVICLLFAGLLVPPVLAEIPGTISYQGKLTDAEGLLINGQRDITFTLFTESSGGGSVWTEPHSDVSVTNGLFNVMLGSTNDLTDEFQENDRLFLEIEVEGEILVPRQEMAAVGYALSAGKAPGYNPVGTVQMYAGLTAPEGWLICDGSAVSRESYADLYAVIGVNYGLGDGSTTFNLPDLRGSFPVGRHSTDSDFDALGKTGGEKTHSLTTAELPSHSHAVNPPSTGTNASGNHRHTVDPPNTNTSTNGSHSHSVTGGDTGFRDDSTGAGFQTASMGWHHAGIGIGSAGNHNHSVNIGQFNSGYAGSHDHSVDIGEFNSGNTGAGEEHNNLPPYQVLNYIIKY